MPEVNDEQLKCLILSVLTNFFKESHSLNEDRLRSREEAALMLGVKTQTLAAWATQGKGPKISKIGTLAKYSQLSLDEYISENTAPR